jgi:AcrR family transcriptional regulator
MYRGKIRRMRETVKARRYSSPLRQGQADETRRAILEAARGLFAEQGYAATTIARIAGQAGVAVDTIYAAIGPKPVLFRQLMETAISGSDQAIPPDQRDYVRRIAAEPTARGKIETYAAAVALINERMAPLYIVFRDAAAQAPDLARVRQEISLRRARNMREFAGNLLATGEVRPDLDAETIADVVWSMNSPEYYVLLVCERRWTRDRFAAWLADAWCRLFLVDEPA